METDKGSYEPALKYDFYTDSSVTRSNFTAFVRKYFEREWKIPFPDIELVVQGGNGKSFNLMGAS
jgi:hypothetical protein